MSVKVKIPSQKGHEVLQLTVEQAQKEVDAKLQAGWVAAINGKLSRNTADLRDNDEVMIFPPVSGG